MNTDQLEKLVEEYHNATPIFRATSYWETYEDDILDAVRSLDPAQLRAGDHPVLATFGFGDTPYYYHPTLPTWKKTTLRVLHRYVIADRGVLPYGLSLHDFQQLAFRHCELLGMTTGAEPISSIETSTFGQPQDVFQANGRPYTMAFLNYYVRYAFAQQNIAFRGDEVIVELGSGSGYQIEVLKKLHPGLTVLCFDLPAPLFLCQMYLSEVFGKESIVGTETTLQWTDLSHVQKGKIHFFGNWQMPMLDRFAFDVFWNAASFGEMEPEVVENYLRFVRGHASWIYLLQARHGKETTGTVRVDKASSFADYDAMLAGYDLQQEHDAWAASGRMVQSGGYFEAVWRLAGTNN